MALIKFYRALRKIFPLWAIFIALEFNPGWISSWNFAWAEETALEMNLPRDTVPGTFQGPDDPNAQSVQEVQEAPRPLMKEGLKLDQVEERILIDDDLSVSGEGGESEMSMAPLPPETEPADVLSEEGAALAEETLPSALDVHSGQSDLLNPNESVESAGDELSGTFGALPSSEPEKPATGKSAGISSEKSEKTNRAKKKAGGEEFSETGIPQVDSSSKKTRKKIGAAVSEEQKSANVSEAVLPRKENAAGLAERKLLLPEDSSARMDSVSEARSVPVSILSSEKPMRSIQIRKTPSNKISASAKLLEELVAASDFQLEGVERIDLRTFLNSPLLSENRDGIRNAVSLYWEAASIRAEIGYWERRAEAMKQMAQNVSSEEQALCELAAASAGANLNSARLLLRANAVKLGNAAGYSREVTAGTLPHAGNYETRYEEIRSSYGEPSARVTYLNGLIALHQEQLSAAAAACAAAENLVKYEMKRKENSTAVILAWDLLNERRAAFFKVLLAFNQDILNYVLEISPKRGADLVPLLVRPVKDVDPQLVPVSGREPILPEPPQERRAAEPTFEQETVSEPQNFSQPLSVPASVESGSAVPGKDGPSIPMITEEDEIRNDAIPLEKTSEVSEEGVTYEENSFITIDVPPEPTVPGGDLGVPAVETPPPGQGFQPIGGETGVDTNPVLTPPGGLDGAMFKSGSEMGVLASMDYSVMKPNAADYASKRTFGGGIAAETVSLRNVLLAAPFESRLHAVDAYWNYVSAQKQICVLEYQQEILKRISRRILKEALQQNDPENSRLGLYLEFHSLVLRAELWENKAAAWKKLTSLMGWIGQTPFWPIVFPEAVTEMKSENFQVRLDRFSPESQDPKALATARQLYFCVQELPEAFQNVSRFGDWIAPSTSNLDESQWVHGLSEMSGSELYSLAWGLKNARICSARYFQLLYLINSSYCSCVLAGPVSEVSDRDKLLLLERYGS
ncbi:MAG: hypothetical protein IJF17_07740 [Thermoguttaceae bacterium]|nr:hypothetical protein [Thermoguttaceae bacterium]